jgi:probable phosphoglycerate mutase
VLVRHGESEPAVEGRPFARVDGHGDPALSPEGREQAAKVCARLAGEHIDAIYVTKLRRTQETAAALVLTSGLAPVVDPDLHEVHLGEWEGGAFRWHVAEGHPLAVRMLTEERWDVIPGAEPAEVFASRVQRGIERIAAAHPDQRVAVFAHGGVIGQVLAHATGARSFAFSGCDNASISHLVVQGPRWTLRRFNDTTHLDEHLSVAAQPPT